MNHTEYHTVVMALYRFHKQSEEIQNGIKEMMNIAMDTSDATSMNDREMAIDTVIEALFPSKPVDL